MLPEANVTPVISTEVQSRSLSTVRYPFARSPTGVHDPDLPIVRVVHRRRLGEPAVRPPDP